MNARRALLAIALAAVLPVAPAPAGVPDARRVIAVFPIKAVGLTLDAEGLDFLSEQLGVFLVSTGVFEVVPRENIKAQLTRQKAESYKECYDSSCQVEIGRELAAEKTISASISRLDDLCVVTLSMFHLERATEEKAATAEGECGTRNLRELLRQAAYRLADKEPPAVAVPARPAPERPAAVAAEAREQHLGLEERVILFCNAFYAALNHWELADWLDMMKLPLEHFYDPQLAPFAGGHTRERLLRIYTGLREKKGRPEIRWGDVSVRALGGDKVEVLIDSYQVYFDGVREPGSSKPKRLKLQEDPGARHGFRVLSILDQ